MLDYIDEIINAFDKADPMCVGTKSNAAPVILFKVNKDCKKIYAKRAVDFHHLVAKILSATKQARTDT